MSDRIRQIDQLMRIARTSPDPRQAQQAHQTAMTMIAEIDYQSTGGGAHYTGGASRDPVDPGHSVIQTDQIHPPNPSDMIQPLMAPSRWLTVPNIPIVSPGQTSPGERLEFSSGGGWLIGFRGIAFDSTAGVESAGRYEQATMAVSMFLNDGENIITNGTGADFASFAELFGDAVQWSPIMRRVDVKDIVNIQFQNLQPVATGNDLQPRLTFAFWREKYPGTG